MKDRIQQSEKTTKQHASLSNSSVTATKCPRRRKKPEAGATSQTLVGQERTRTEQCMCEAGKCLCAQVLTRAWMCRAVAFAGGGGPSQESRAHIIVASNCERFGHKGAE